MNDSFVVFLASKSPRRRELLDQIRVSYRLLSAEIDETPVVGETPSDYVVRMAREKALAGLAVRPQNSGQPVLGADTAVVVDSDILGKPADRREGLAMLARLSGREHRVLSAVCLADHARVELRISETRVVLRPLSDTEMTDYWASGEPCDKAGAYGIQGIAAQFVERIEGSYSGVVGLPLYETAELLAAWRINGDKR